MNNVARFIHQYQQQQVQLNHRGLVCLVGEQAWFLEQVNAFMAMHELLVSPIVTLTYSTATATSEVLQSNFHTNTYANIQVKQVDKKNYRYLLGTETDYFIYLNDDIEPDMFAALCGTIKAGGLVFIGWRTIPTNKSSIYHQRFYRELCYSQSTLIFLQKSSDLENEKYLLAVLAATKLKRTEDASQLESCQIELCESPEKLNFHCVTEDQLFAVEAIKKVMLGHRNRPLTLTADRGRGKTTALALACIELIKSSDTSLNIVITAPNIAALSSFFRTIELFLPSALVDKSQVHFNHSTIKFLPLDCLLTEKSRRQAS